MTDYYGKDHVQERKEQIETLKWQIKQGYLKPEDFDQALKNWEEGKI